MQLLPFTLWLSTGLVQRLGSFLAPLVLAAPPPPSAPGSTAAVGSAYQPAHAPHAPWTQGAGGPGVVQYATGRDVTGRSAAERLLDDILAGSAAGRAAPKQQAQQQAGVLAGAELQASIGVAHVCVVLALAAPGGAQASGASNEQALLGQRYAVLDMFADVPQPHHMPLHHHQPAPQPQRQSGRSGRQHTAAAVGAGSNGGAAPGAPQPLLRCRRAAAAGRAAAGVAAAQGEPVVVELTLTRLRLHLVGCPYGGLPQRASAAGGRPRAPPGKLHASCILDAAPSGGRSGAKASAATTAAGGASAAADAVVGPDDVPYGAALYAEVVLDGGAAPEPSALTAAAALVAQHAQDRWAEADAGGWEDAARFGALDLQQRCRRGCSMSAHVRAPGVSSELSRTDVLALGAALAAAAAQLGSAASAFASDAPPLQTAVLLQCRVRCSLQVPPPPAAPAAVPLRTTPGAPAPQHYPSVPAPAASAAALNVFEVTAEEVTLFNASNLGGYAGAAAASLSISGLQLVRGADRAVCLYCPGQSHATGCWPSVELLNVSPGPSRDAVAAAPALARGALTSLLISGVTASLDAGSLDCSWAAQLAQLANVLPLPDQATEEQAAAVQPTANRFVVSLVDIGLRAEPAPLAAHAPHGTSRVAAALLLEGAHWALDAAPRASQVVQLHGLSFHVAAAAKRSGGAGSWAPSVPRDLHALSLQGQGYHCVAQEGCLTLLMRPHRACLEHGGGHTTW